MAALLLTVSFSGCSGKKERKLTDIEFTKASLTATDALGRRVEAVDSQKSGYYVGIFYSLWLGQHQDIQRDIYNITELLEKDPDALWDTKGNEKSPLGQFHFADEPLYGYYSMTDPWVVSHHIELLTMAGIDYLMFDATNMSIYPASGENVLSTLLKYQNQGWDVPKAAFYTNSGANQTAQLIYDTYYKDGRFDDVWFKPEGKPVIISITEDNNGASDQTSGSRPPIEYISETLQEYFDVYESSWPNARNFNENGWPWMSWDYPQFSHDGRISVSVAQHSPLTAKFSEKYHTSSRGYDHIRDVIEEDWKAGANFRTQWETVFMLQKNGLEVNNVLVTSFNEWMAIKYVEKGIEPEATQNGQLTYFVDVFDQEYSRDIEMDKSGYGDNFYLQLMQNIRKFKYSAGTGKYDWKKASPDIEDSSLSSWEGAGKLFRDFEGEVMARNHRAAAGRGTYKDSSNRNDVVSVRVAHDKSNLYMLVRTKDDITEHDGTDTNWMNVLIKAGSGKDSFEGYQYAVNRRPGENGKTMVERSTGGYNFTAAGEAEYRVYGNALAIKIPLSLLGLSKDNVKIEFKVTDNITHPEDIMDYYVSGESAPIGRLSYSYGY